MFLNFTWEKQFESYGTWEALYIIYIPLDPLHVRSMHLLDLMFFYRNSKDTGSLLPYVLPNSTKLADLCNNWLNWSRTIVNFNYFWINITAIVASGNTENWTRRNHILERRNRRNFKKLKVITKKKWGYNLWLSFIAIYSRIVNFITYLLDKLQIWWLLIITDCEYMLIDSLFVCCWYLWWGFDFLKKIFLKNIENFNSIFQIPVTIRGL